MNRAAVLFTTLALIAAPALASSATVAAGGSHTVVIKTTDGTVWAWGANESGQLGDGNTVEGGTPIQVGGLSGIAAVAAGARHTLALKSDGTVWAWGDNEYGQLGDGASGADADRATPAQVAGAGFTNIVAIAAGENHSVALKNDGTVWTWGRNDHGQLAIGGTTDRTTPSAVVGFCCANQLMRRRA